MKIHPLSQKRKNVLSFQKRDKSIAIVRLPKGGSASHALGDAKDQFFHILNA